MARSTTELLDAKVDIASLVAFRALFGGLMFAAVVRFFVHDWIGTYFLAPQLFFPYFGLTCIRPWPGAGMYLHYAIMGASALCILVGLAYRAAMVLFFLTFTYAHLIDRTNYLNHYYLVSLLALLMIFLPLHRAASIDARLFPNIRQREVPAWALFALRFQVGVVYFFGGVAKLKADWLLQAQPLRIWLAANTDVPVLGPLCDHATTAYVMSYAGALFDLTTPFLLLFGRTRPFAYAAVLGFHLLTARLFQLGLFPWIMSLCALLFFPPDWPRRVPGLSRVVGRPLPLPAPSPAPEPKAPTSIARVGLALLLVHGALQLLLPLRCHLYPGNVLWHEQGFRFAWNVMLMEKNGVADFFVQSGRSGARYQVELRRYLTPYQIKMMSSQPDMILSFAHHLREEALARGARDVSVYADVFVSLNGRPPRRLIDGAADLAAIEEGLGNKRWILPFPDDS